MKRQRGQAAVEAALVLPVLLTMLTAVLSFGLAFTDVLIITNACRDSARYATLGNSANAVTTRVQDDLQTAGLDPSSASINLTNAGGTSGTDVTVAVTYPVQLFIPVPGLPNPLNVSSKATMRIE